MRIGGQDEVRRATTSTKQLSTPAKSRGHETDKNRGVGVPSTSPRPIVRLNLILHRGRKCLIGNEIGGFWPPGMGGT
jgi:hypothetical protein